MVKITERKTKRDWAYFMEEIALQQENADKITLVMDNLNTHVPGSLYEVFPPAKAKALWDRFEFVYTPKHGSWLNIAEIELNVLSFCATRSYAMNCFNATLSIWGNPTRMCVISNDGVQSFWDNVRTSENPVQITC